MDLNKLKDYKVNENSVFTDSDKKHIENYKQLSKFFENAIQSSISEKGVNYISLHNSCIQCIRFLDNLIFTYDISVENIRYLNKTIDKIIKDNTPVGNEKQKETPL